MPRKHILPVALVALVVVVGYEKYKGSAPAGHKTASPLRVQL